MRTFKVFNCKILLHNDAGMERFGRPFRFHKIVRKRHFCKTLSNSCACWKVWMKHQDPGSTWVVNILTLGSSYNDLWCQKIRLKTRNAQVEAHMCLCTWSDWCYIICPDFERHFCLTQQFQNLPCEKHWLVNESHHRLSFGDWRPVSASIENRTLPFAWGFTVNLLIQIIE